MYMAMQNLKRNAIAAHQLVQCLCINKHVHTRLHADHLQYGMLACQQQPFFGCGAAMRVCPALKSTSALAGAQGDGVDCRLYQHVLVRCEVCQSLVKAGTLLLTEATMGCALHSDL